MDIEHLGEKVIDLLVDRGLVKDFADLYGLTVRQVARLEGFAAKSAENLVEAVAASRTRGLARLLNGLGIPGVGEHVARVLARHFPSLDYLLGASTRVLAEVPGVGPTIAASVVSFLSDTTNRRVLDRLAAAGVAMVERERSAGRGALAGKTVVLTGALEGLSRAAAEDLILQAGGRVSTSVSPRTDFVVVGEAPGSKLDTARRLGIAELDERALMAMARPT
jgi:DNA ligase (NAD+)